ncbi:MAG TPA: RNA polymerase factor sigma-54, partial [Thermoanaerobaculia bacterium]|nr:RNA polymerase factor sigma-54 [Thermoanaerobaculia bacterium]
MPLHQKLGLSARLSQRLILTPSLQQAIKLLPLTTLELAEVLDQEVMENPLLEEEPVEETKTVEEIAQEETAERERPDDPLKEIDIERFFEDYFNDGADRRTRPSEVPEVAPIENTLTESPDLYDHLLWQLRMTEADEATLEIGEAIIQNLDEDGLLRVSLEDVAAMGPWPMEAVETTLALVQALDPPGVAARSLTESLRIQLRVLGLENSPADVMVRDHMKQLQSHQYPEISRHMGLSADEVAHYLEIIRGLSPRPGSGYSAKRSDYVLPDVFVVKEGEEYKIVLNDDGLPKLRISPTYRRLLDHKEPGSEETRAYVKDKLRSALWLLKSVDQRQRTIYKVAESIVRHQRAFLDHGITHLRPLVLRDVASDIGMHESTVSRVVANK